MSKSMADHIIQRHRWDGLVVFAWALALATIVLSIWMIAEFGVIEVPSFVGLTYSRTETHYNYMIWGYGIGLSISAILLAGLFSMINSAYKNSCDQLAASTRIEAMLKIQAGDSEPDPEGEIASASPEWGLQVEWVNPDSPFRWVLHPGCVIVSINGIPANNTKQAQSMITDGENIIEVITAQGRRVTKEVHMSKGYFGVRAEPRKLAT